MDLPPPPPPPPAQTVADVAEGGASQDLRESLTAYVRSRCDVVRVEVRDVGLSVEPGADEALIWTGDPCRPFPALTLRRGTHRHSAHPVLDLWMTGPVAPHDVQPGEVFHVEHGPVPWRAAQANPLTGRVVARSAIARGQPVTPSLARRQPDASNGQAVSLVVTHGEVSIRAPGVMLGPAFIGERVAVRNEATRVVQHGVLIDSSTVSLTP